MFQNIISSLILILIIILGFAAYIILFEIQEIKSPSIALDLKQYQIDESGQNEELNKSLKTSFKKYINTQLRWVKGHDNSSTQYDNILKDIADKQKVIYIEEYEKDVELKKAELEGRFSEFKENLRKETEKRLQQDINLIEKDIKESVTNLTNSYNNEFEEYKKEVQQEKGNELLNYRLKLKVLDLSEQEASEYREKIKKIENTRKAMLNSKLSGLNYELKVKIAELEQGKNKKITVFKEDLIKKEELKISGRKKYLEDVLTAYKENRRDLLEQSINDFEGEVKTVSKNIKNNREEITKIVKKDLEFLEEQYSNFAEGE